jgi:hypothetical protein
MVFLEHGVTTSLTGNLSGAMMIEAFGSLFLAIVAAYVLYRFARFVFDALDRAEEYSEQSYRSRAYIKLMVTGLQAGMLKQVAESEKVDLAKEIELIPTDGNNPISKEIKQKLMKDIKDYGI